MTHFKVSDEAVRVAGEAVEKATAELEMVQSVAYDREVSEAIARAAIEAALPVMFEEIGHVYNIFGDPERFAERDLAITADLQPLRIGTKAYVVKEPK
jgi:hypothetical protein